MFDVNVFRIAKRFYVRFCVQQQGNQLVISNVQSHDAGRYTCICHTENGQQFLSEYELTVEEEPLKNEVLPPKVEYAEVGSTTTLKCNTDRHPIRYHWSRQHGQFSAGQDINGVRFLSPFRTEFE